MKKIVSIVTFIIICNMQLIAGEYIVLIDYSKSISKKDQKIYQQTLGSILSKIKSGDRISLLNIGQSDVTNFDFFAQFETKVGSTNQIKIYNKKGLKKLWSDFLKKPFETEESTRIISALRGSAQQFSNSNSDNKILIILSDMIDSTRESYVYEYANNKNCSSISKRVQKIDKPNLNNVKVYVAGAGGEGDAGYRCLEKYWKEFFMESGINESDIVYQHINPFN